MNRIDRNEADPEQMAKFAAAAARVAAAQLKARLNTQATRARRKATARNFTR